ncbi:MAG: hypothetical protein AAGE80_05425 [Pseudomonadota bacterium]
MTSPRKPILGIAAAVALAPTFAEAQGPFCMPHPAMVRGLMSDHAERVSFSGVTHAGEHLEVFVSDDTGRWSLIASRPIRPGLVMSCLIATGNHHEIIKPEPERTIQ